MRLSELIGQLQSAMEHTGEVECYIDLSINDGKMIQTSTIDRVTMYGPMDSEGHIEGGTIGVVTELKVMGSIDTRNFLAYQFNDAFDAIINK